MAAGGSTRTPAEQVAREVRLAPYAAAAAAAAAVLFLASLYPVVAIRAAARTRPAQLLRIDEHPAEFLIGAVLAALSTLALGATLAYLYSATRHRRRELPTAALTLALFGAALAGASGVVTQLQIIDVAHDFAASGARTEARADDLVKDGVSGVVGALGFAGNLALGFAVFLISLNAMRAGLLSRFMGVLGIVVGVLYVIPLLSGPQIIQLLWLGALAALFLDRWPGGRGPAWAAGEAIPWPTPAEQRAAADRSGEEGEEGGDGAQAGSADIGGSPLDRVHAATGRGSLGDGAESPAIGDEGGEEDADRPAGGDPDTPRRAAPAKRRRRRRRR